MNNINKLLIIFFIILAIFIWHRTKINEAPKPYNYATSDFKIKSPYYAEKIPNSVYLNTKESDKLFKVINSDKKIIYYSYANSPMGNSIKYNIQAGLDKENLNYYYNFEPNLQSSLTRIRCKNKTNLCAQPYLIENCSDKVCIIHPKRKEIVKINNGDFVEIIRKAKYLKRW